VNPIHTGVETLERYSVFGEVQAPLAARSWLPRLIERVDAISPSATSRANDSKRNERGADICVESQAARRLRLSRQREHLEPFPDVRR
jgi:hypothetical protein